MILCRALSYEENTLDKSRLKKVSCKSLQKIIIFQIRVSMWTTVFQAVTSKDPHFSR